jgi:hypothetical protein
MGTMTVALRWEATGAAGEAFPVVHADLILASDGDDRSLLALAGTYRPPAGQDRAAAGKASTPRLAIAVNRSRLAGIAYAITPWPESPATAPAIYG